MPSIRGVVERARQRFHIGEKDFRPTPNVRNPAMLLEAEDFAQHVTKYRHILHKYEKHLETFLSTLPIASRSNLPRVWEAVEGTNMCEPVSSEITSRHGYRAGGDFDEMLMADALEIMRRRIDAILRPLERWHNSLDVVKTRMHRLEGLRMQVDARRRRVHKRFLRALRSLPTGEMAAVQAELPGSRSRRLTSAGGSITSGVGGGGGAEEQVAGEGGMASPGAYAGRTGGSTALGFNADLSEDDDYQQQRTREDQAREAVKQHRQLEAVSESYREQEQLVFEQLSGLVRDAAFFKSYVAASLLVIKDTLQATLVGLGPCKRPLPGFSEREPVDSSNLYGRIDTLTDLIADLPLVLKTGGRQLPAGARSTASVEPEQLRPKRVTAQPLQVAADDVSGPEARYMPVAPVTKPASQVPSSALPAGGGEWPEVEEGGGNPYPETAALGYEEGGVVGRPAGGPTSYPPPQDYEMMGEYGYGGVPGSGQTFNALQEEVSHA